MKTKMKTAAYFSFLTALVAVTSTASAAELLSNGNTAGTVGILVDGFGAFGDGTGPIATPYTVDFVVPSGPGAGTTVSPVFESAVGLRINGVSASGNFLTTGTITSVANTYGGLVNPTQTGNTTSLKSEFIQSGLKFVLEQHLENLLDGNAQQIGSTVVQTYSIQNISGGAINFDLLRFADADWGLPPAGTLGYLDDGGGRFLSNGREWLATTDTPVGPNGVSAFAAIAADGGNQSGPDRFRFGPRFGTDSLIDFGSLTDTVVGDTNADGYVDIADDYTMALRNGFSLADGEFTTYTTYTSFGVGVAADTLAQVPETNTMVAGGVLVCLMVWHLRRRKAPAVA